MDARRVLLIRHGESTWNAAGRWQGWGDPPLSPRGREQAKTLAERLAEQAVSRLVSSDLERASQTAVILAETLDLPVVLDPRLRERDLGCWAGLTEAEIRAAHPEDLDRLRARDPAVRPGGGESHDAFRLRVAPALVAAAHGSAAGTIAVVTHLGVIRLLDRALRPGNADVVEIDPARLRELAKDR